MAEENNEQVIEDDPIEVRRAKREAHLNRIVFDYLLVVFFCHVNSLKLA